MGSKCQAIRKMRLHAFFALFLIAHVCSAEFLSFHEQVLAEVLEKINTLTEKVDTLFELYKQDFEDNFRCPTEKSGYRILEGQCYFFEKVDLAYSATQEYCKTAFGPNVVGKLWEPKSLKINNEVGTEAKDIFGSSSSSGSFWIGISNDGKFRYQSSGETATWDMPYYNEYQKTGNIGTSFCLYYNLY